MGEHGATRGEKEDDDDDDVVDVAEGDDVDDEFLLCLIALYPSIETAISPCPYVLLKEAAPQPKGGRKGDTAERKEGRS